jgi:dTDP-4-dehydrorhamnose reductase
MVCPTEDLADLVTLKKVLKSVVQLEERRRNVIIFGLIEQKDENVEERVQEVFEVIGLKPTVQASRAEKTSMKNSKRPVKISLSTTSTSYQILIQVHKLRHSAKYSLT